MIENTRQHVVGEFPKGNPIISSLVETAYRDLYAGKCQGADMRGWLTWPGEYIRSDEYKRVKATAKKIREENTAVVIVGIGGSYLTPQMIINSEYGEFYNETSWQRGTPRIYYAGCDLSPDKLNQIVELLYAEEWSIIYISKSGGTMEPALSFRVLWDKLFEQYGDAANSRVYAITDANRGILKDMADENGWESFVIPDDIGGRFSGLTAVGLMPIAVAGIDTDAILKGAIDAMNDCKDNPNSFAGEYAEWRYRNYAEGEKVEFLATNTPYLSFCSEWLKQLFGESEGKEQEGLFPASGIFPTDLHSLGQYLQEGTRNLIFETFIKRKFKNEIYIPESQLNDNLSGYVGKGFSQAASAAMHGAYNAHNAGGNPCAMIEVDETLEAMGALMYYSFVTTATTAIAMGVNPFNQPGVEFHKQEMKKSPEWNK